MASHIHIKRELKDGRSIDLIQFEEGKTASFVHQFYTQRGLTKYEQHKTNAITIRILRRELLQEIERMRTNGDTQALLAYQRGYEQLDAAIRTLNKEDKLILVNHMPVAL